MRRPEPRAIGWASRGAEIVAGRLRLDGAVVDAAGFPDGLPERATAELHGFGWLDDLAALGTPAARDVAQAAVLAWVRQRPEPGTGPVWRADVTGRRVMRWVFHAGTLLPGLDRAASTPIFASLHAQLGHLRRHLSETSLEAAAGLAIAAMSLRGAEAHLPPALEALAAAADRLPADDPRRNPEAQLETAALLAWVIDTAAEARVKLPPPLRAALARIAPVLRGLRHADGGLPRMHGGGAGAPGRLDQVLRAAGPAPPIEGAAMGFRRLSRGRSTVVLDAAPPPAGEHGQASTLGFEFTVARHPLIVGCGSGRRFGADWAMAGRASPACSTLVLDGLSSAQLDAVGGLDPAPGRVRVQGDAGEGDGLAANVRAAHDGWRESHGLDHLRALRLAPDGLALQGEDALEPVGAAGGTAREAALHFHLHPEVASGLSQDGVALRLPSGEGWRFGHEGGALTLEPSAWLDPAQPRPRPSRQIVLRAPLVSGTPWKIAWQLTRV
nr:heparinase II/III family protein [Paracoccus sp. S-4012]